MKKFSALLIAFILFFSATITHAEFIDVDLKHLNLDAIQYVKNQGIVNGYEDGTYQPEKNINRAEFTKIIMASAFPDEKGGAGCFPDVQNEWYAQYVCLAKEKGIIGGYPDGTFRPNQTINFVEASKIIVNAFGYEVEENTEVWFQPFVTNLGNRNAIPTTIYSFEKNVNRGEMAEMMYRLKLKIEKKPSKTFLELSGEQENPDRINPTLGFQISSTAFGNGEKIPLKYAHESCGGENVIPPLQWINPPENTDKFVLLVTDADANAFVHWAIYNIPSTVTEIKEGEVPENATELINDYKKIGYGGPCTKNSHKYRFTLYAVRKPLLNVNRKNLAEKLLQSKIEAIELTGTFQ